jgi:hypothetical protein
VQDVARRMCAGDYGAQQDIEQGLRGSGSLTSFAAANALSLAYQNCPDATDYGSIFGTLKQGGQCGHSLQQVLLHDSNKPLFCLHLEHRAKGRNSC